jgi:hypothetical protein
VVVEVVAVVVYGTTTHYWTLESHYSGLKKYDVLWGVPVSHSPKTLSTGVNITKKIQVHPYSNMYLVNNKHTTAPFL